MKTKLVSLFALALAMFILAPSVVACPRTQNSYGPPWYNDAWADHMPAQYQPDRGKPFKEETKIEAPKQQGSKCSSPRKFKRHGRKCLRKVTIYRGSEKTIRMVAKAGCFKHKNRIMQYNGSKRKMLRLKNVDVNNPPQQMDPQVAPPPHLNLIEVYKGGKRAIMIVK
jgi:hypothetical protein